MSKKDRKLNKAIKNNNTRVQNFFEIAEIKEDHILTTRNEEKYFLEVKPKNITVLSKPIRLGIIDSLTNIISELPKSEILCLNNSNVCRFFALIQCTTRIFRFVFRVVQTSNRHLCNIFYIKYTNRFRCGCILYSRRCRCMGFDFIHRCYACCGRSSENFTAIWT